MKPMRTDTLFRLASMTKPITTVAVLMLMEEGKLILSDPVSKFIPEFKNPKVAVWNLPNDARGAGVRLVSADREVTLKHLLTHTAGLADANADGPTGAALRQAELSPRLSLAEYSKRVGGLPLRFQPGTQWEYSMAVDVQAALVEKLSGEPFADYVRDHIFEPLKMRETAWRQPDDRLPRFAAMNVMTDGKLIQQSDAAARLLNFQDHALTPGGFGLASTLDDYQRFARMLLGRGELDGVRILKPSTVRLMATDQLDPSITQRAWLPGKGAMGFGFDFAVRKAQPLTPDENRGAVGEFFWDGLPSTLFWVDPANRLTVVFFVQSQPFDGTLHRDFRAAVYGRDYQGPPGD